MVCVCPCSPPAVWGSELFPVAAQPLPSLGWFLLLSQGSWSPWFRALGHRALLAGIHVPCAQSRPLYINSNVLAVSLHREGVRTVAFLSFACKSMAEARSPWANKQWAQFVLRPSLKLPFSS